jgi:4-azaleucine resistance transporter AzlC
VPTISPDSEPADPGHHLAGGWRSEFRDGILAILPAVLACIPFALVLGAFAVQKGLGALDVGLFSAFVFAGGAQFLAVELWTNPAPWAALAFAVLLVNLRHVLMSASIAPKLSAFPRWLRPLALFFLADELWAMAEQRAASRTLTPAFWFGMATALFGNWLVFSVAGTVIGARIADPKMLGFDIAFTAIFVALIAGFWRGRSSFVVVAVAAGVSVAVKLLVPGAWYVIAGALAGVLAAAAMHAPPQPAGEESPLP